MGDRNQYSCSKVSMHLRSFHLCTVHTVENQAEKELCSAVAAVYLVYFQLV